jgi:hypothetical protein
MDPCGPIQAQLLDFLYDLLEADEHRALREHLDYCTTCQAALRQARDQQQLLAAAARMEFPQVRFEPPAEVLPFRQQPAAAHGRRSWKRYRGLALALGAAAVVLLALGVGAYDYRSACATVNEGRGRFENARDAAAGLEKQARLARANRDTRLSDLANRPLDVVVSGPETVQPGAPNDYRIETRKGKETVPAVLTVRVRDEANRVLEEKKDVASNGNYRLELPPNLPVKPSARLSLEVVARRDGGAEEELHEELPLASPLYVTHLVTDRPLYRAGETVFYRSLTLERFSLKPPDEDFELVFVLRKPDKTEETLGTQMSRVAHANSGRLMPFLGLNGQPLRGLGAGEYRLPDKAPGGEWALIVKEAHDRFPAQERRFLVNTYEPQKLNKELEWSQRSYGPGDEVTAHCSVETADHRKVACAVTPTLVVDHVEYGADAKEGRLPALRTDADGKVAIHFRLPRAIPTGDVNLSVKFEDGANSETISKPVPVVLNTLRVNFYPEGGDLVAGVSNRVYFQVHGTRGKPADLRGRVVDDKGKVVKEGVTTFHVADRPGANQGMGVFELTPEAGRTYELKIDAPLGIEGKHELPAVKPDGVVLSVPDGVSNPDQPLRVVVRSPGRGRALLVGAYCRGRLMDHQRLTVKPNDPAAVDLQPSDQVGGVYRVTVFEEQPGDGRAHLKPLAERLVYRVPARRLQLTTTPDRSQYAPGDHVTLGIRATDEKDQPVPAVLLIGVVDRGVLALADDKTALTMPTHFLLASEVSRPEDLEHADFLLGPGPEARTALDLLLGTQGWRRFVEQRPALSRSPKDPIARLDPVTRLLVSNGQKLEQVDFQQREKDKVEQAYRAAVLTLGEQLARAEEARRGAEAALAAAPFTQAEAKLATYNRVFDALRDWGLPVLIGALALVGLGGLIVGAARKAWRPVPYAVGALACSLVLGVLAFQLSGGKLPETSARPGIPVALGNPGGMRIAIGPEAAPGDQGPGRHGVMQPFNQGAEKPSHTVPGLPALPAREVLPVPDADAGVMAKDAGEKQRRALERLAQLAGDPAPVAPPLQPCIIREYAFHHEASGTPGVRAQFPETVYWNPVVVLPDGQTLAGFDLGDAVTSYQVAVLGHTLDGRIGSCTGTVAARLPLSVDPKLPTEVSAADKIDVPVSVANNTAEPRDVELRVAATGLAARDGGPDAARVTVPAGERRRRVFRFRPDLIEGPVSLEVHGTAGPSLADAVRRTFAVVPEGFPVVASHSDLLEKSATVPVVLPPTWVKGTLRLKADVYPSTLADLQKGLESLLREPSGCFEQTSSSTYPNLLILDYLKETDQARPEVESRARGMLDRGYEQLTKFECPYGEERRGFEWFGAPNAAHEALTAYGLLEFRDLARVHAVDPALLERTRQYLLDQRDGRGGFKRNPRALDTFGRAPQDVTNAYLVWALTETGKGDDLARELDALAAEAKQSPDPYFLALVANSLLNRDRGAEGVALLKALAARQNEDGHLDAAKTSITGSGGRPLQVETTALAVLGWLKANRPAEFNGPVRKAVEWIGRQRGGFGGYGSTQSTILALKALIGYARQNKKTTTAGEVRLVVGDALLARTNFQAGAQDVLTLSLPEPEKHLHPGTNDVRVEITGGNVFPCTVSWSYQAPQPPSAANAPVRLQTRLDRATADEGDTLHLTVTVENATGQGQGMAVAVVGLPAGVTLPEDLKQLKQHAELRNDGQERGLIDFFEVRGRELVLYWRDLAPHQKIDVPVDLICRVPGEYRGPASRAYLYYNGDGKCWIDPLQVTIKAEE